MHRLDGTNKGESSDGNDPYPQLVDPRRLHRRCRTAGGAARPRPHPRRAPRAEAFRLVRGLWNRRHQRLLRADRLPARAPLRERRRTLRAHRGSPHSARPPRPGRTGTDGGGDDRRDGERALAERLLHVVARDRVHAGDRRRWLGARPRRSWSVLARRAVRARVALGAPDRVGGPRPRHRRRRGESRDPAAGPGGIPGRRRRRNPPSRGKGEEDSTLTTNSPIRPNLARTITTAAPEPGFAGPGHTAVLVVDPADFPSQDPFILLADDRLDMAPGAPVGGEHPHAGFDDRK